MTRLIITTDSGVRIRVCVSMSICKIVMLLKNMMKESEVSSDMMLAIITKKCVCRPFQGKEDHQFGSVWLDFKAEGIMWRLPGKNDPRMTTFSKIRPKELAVA